MFAVPRKAHAVFRSSILLLLLLALTGGCSVPEARPLADEDLEEAVAQRRNAELELLEAAWGLCETPPLGLGLQDAAGPAEVRWWQNRALAHAPALRAARRAWRAAEAARPAAGQPRRPGASASAMDFDDLEGSGQVAATLDLLGLLGVGPYAADRMVAARVSGVARGSLEVEAWRAWHEAARAFQRVRSIRRQRSRLAQLLDEAAPSLRRLELLHDLGRLGEGPLGMVQGALANVALMRRRLAAEEVRRVEALAAATGVAPDSAAFAAIGGEELRVPGGDLASLAPRDLVARRPDLRRAREAYALSEARLRAAAARYWPGLNLGGQVRPDGWLTGGMLAFDLPWPPRVRASVRAALERREAAREALEDALVRALQQVEARRGEAEVAREELLTEVIAFEGSTARTWNALRVRLQVEEGHEVLEPFAGMVNTRAQAVVARALAAERVLIAELSLGEARGSEAAAGGVALARRGERGAP